MAAHIDQAAWERKVRIRINVLLIAAAAVALFIGTFCLIKFLIIPADQYKKAEAALEAGDATSAVDYFGAAGRYKDSVTRAAEIAAGLQEDAGLIETLRNAEIGSVVTLGQYEQDNRTGTGLEPIEWIVMMKKDGRVLLLSKYVLFNARYNEKKEDVTWETCTLRKLLNEEFINDAFSPAERLLIARTYLENEANPISSKSNTVGGKATRDRIFILSYGDFLSIARSMDDGLDLFSLDARPTDYAYRHGVYRNPDYLTASYWCRTPGMAQSTVVFVDPEGTPLHTMRVDQAGFGVRPALWIYVGN